MCMCMKCMMKQAAKIINKFLKSFLQKHIKNVIKPSYSITIRYQTLFLQGSAEMGPWKCLSLKGGCTIFEHILCNRKPYTKILGSFKVAKIRATNFNEADLITCFANDYGYERLFEKAIQFYGDEGDLVILISSSGSSANVVNAAKYAKQLKMKVITLSGFENDNPLKKEGDINFWVNSKAYNHVENVHQILLLMLVDLVIGKTEYPPN